MDVPELMLVMGVVFLLCILPYDLIRWLLWGRLKYYRKYSQYEDSGKRFLREKENALKKANKLISNAKEYCDIINKTTNIDIFELYFQKLKSTLEELVQLEQYDIFPGVTPAEDLEELLLHEADLRETFEERVKSKNTHTIKTSSSTSHKVPYGMNDEELRCFALLCNNELEKEDRIDAI